MRLLRSCCFCVSLRNACVIIGVVGIIWSALILILAFTSLVKFNLIDANVTPVATKIIIVFNTLIWITISVLLILGTIKEKGKFLVPWLIISLCLIVGFLTSTIYSMVYDFTAKNYSAGFLTLFSATLSILFFVYLWIVVYSYFDKIRTVFLPVRV